MQKLNNSPLKFIRYIPDAIGYIALTTIIVLEGTQAVARYVFRSPLLFVDDVVTLCFAWVIFVGSAVAYKYGMHYGLEVMYKILPEKAHPYYMIFLKVLCLGLLCILFRLSWVLLSKVGTKILLTTQIPYKYVDWAIVVGMALMIIYTIQFIIHDIMVLVNKKKEAGKEAEA